MPSMVSAWVVAPPWCMQPHATSLPHLFNSLHLLYQPYPVMDYWILGSVAHHCRQPLPPCFSAVNHHTNHSTYVLMWWIAWPLSWLSSSVAHMAFFISNINQPASEPICAPFCLIFMLYSFKSVCWLSCIEKHTHTSVTESVLTCTCTYVFVWWIAWPPSWLSCRPHHPNPLPHLLH